MVCLPACGVPDPLTCLPGIKAFHCISVCLPTRLQAVSLPACLPADPVQIKPLKLMATKWHIFFGLMIVLGLLLQKIM